MLQNPNGSVRKNENSVTSRHPHTGEEHKGTSIESMIFSFYDEDRFGRDVKRDSQGELIAIPVLSCNCICKLKQTFRSRTIEAVAKRSPNGQTGVQNVRITILARGSRENAWLSSKERRSLWSLRGERV